MFETLEQGIVTGAQQGAEYVELRAEDIALTIIGYADGRIDNLNAHAQSGVACRVLYDGTWGFSCGTLDDTEHLVKKACALARVASPHRKEKIRLQEVNPCMDETKKEFRIPPQDVSFEEKISRLDNLYALIQNYDKRIKAVSLKYTDSHGFKYLVTSEGTQISQEIGHVYNSCWVTGKENDTLTAARDVTGSTDKGYEYFERVTGEEIAEKVGRQVVLQLEGKSPKNGSFPCVLGPGVVGVLVHEALGHLAEADFTINSSLNGKLGEKVAPDTINMVDAPIEGTFGALKYDDEGVPMQRCDIVKDGIFSGLLTDREYSYKTGLPVCGASRAESFLFPPLIRMRNTFFDRGDHMPEELFDCIDFGYYCVNHRGGETQLNSSFQVMIQEAFEIHHGELGNSVKDLAISGVATEALFLIEGVGRELQFEEGHCGKDQVAAVSSGGPHLRIREGGILFGGRG